MVGVGPASLPDLAGRERVVKRAPSHNNVSASLGVHGQMLFLVGCAPLMGTAQHAVCGHTGKGKHIKSFLHKQMQKQTETGLSSRADTEVGTGIPAHRMREQVCSNTHTYINTDVCARSMSRVQTL